MRLNLVGKFSNAWGAEHMVYRALRALGHEVYAFELGRPLDIFKGAHTDGALTIVMQGYGLSPQVIQHGRRLTGGPWVLWHAEVMSPEWPTSDPVVAAKADRLRENAWAYDAIFHNCHCCLRTVLQIAAEGAIGGRPVPKIGWAPANGVDAEVHRRLPNIEKQYLVGFYGYPSPRRVEFIKWLKQHDIEVEWRQPGDGCWGEGLIEFIHQCHYILNLHFSSTINTECRLYEALGCGVPVISEPISMPELFAYAKECGGIQYFHSPDEWLEIMRCARSMANSASDKLSAIGQRCMQWIHAHASYRQRCQQLLNLMTNEVLVKP